MATSIEDFLTSNQEQQVVDAIRAAEKKTSGEIRVHLEDYHEKKEIEKRTKEVFHLLKMNNTKQENGVILYVAVNLKQFFIYGDRGINNLVGSNFWNSTRDIILKEFKQQQFTEGLILGINEIGNVLKTHFPWNVDDANELPDQISKL